jgi:hypothetical protein
VCVCVCVCVCVYVCIYVYAVIYGVKSWMVCRCLERSLCGKILGIFGVSCGLGLRCVRI